MSINDDKISRQTSLIERHSATVPRERTRRCTQPFSNDTHRGGRSEPAGAQEFAVATDRYLSRGRSTARASRIKRSAAEFNALHVGYFAVPPCAMVKVHAGARACACTHTRGRRSAGRLARSLAPFASRTSACVLLRGSSVRLRTRLALTSGKKNPSPLWRNEENTME